MRIKTSSHQYSTVQCDTEPCMFTPNTQTVQPHLHGFTPPRHTNSQHSHSRHLAAEVLFLPAFTSTLVLCASAIRFHPSHCSRMELHHFFVYPVSCCPVGLPYKHTHAVTHTDVDRLQFISLCLPPSLLLHTAFEFGQFSLCAQSSLAALGRQASGGETGERRRIRKTI